MPTNFDSLFSSSEQKPVTRQSERVPRSKSSSEMSPRNSLSRSSAQAEVESSLAAGRLYASDSNLSPRGRGRGKASPRASEDRVLSSPSRSSEARRSRASTTGSPRTRRVICKESFQANESDQLSVNPGDVLELVDDEAASDMLLVRRGDVQGLVPNGVCMKYMSPRSSLRETSPRSSMSEASPRSSVAEMSPRTSMSSK